MWRHSANGSTLWPGGPTRTWLDSWCRCCKLFFLVLLLMISLCCGLLAGSPESLTSNNQNNTPLAPVVGDMVYWKHTLGRARRRPGSSPGVAVVGQLLFAYLLTVKDEWLDSYTETGQKFVKVLHRYIIDYCRRCFVSGSTSRGQSAGKRPGSSPGAADVFLALSLYLQDLKYAVMSYISSDWKSTMNLIHTCSGTFGVMVHWKHVLA